MTMDLAAIATVAQEAVREAAEYVRRRLDDPIEAMRKSERGELVTEVDRTVERMVVDRILRAFPDHGILGEEGVFTRADAPAPEVPLWVIDPIDGTTNFVHQRINFVLSLAVYHGGEGLIGIVYDPLRDEWFEARRGEGATLNGRPIRVRPDASRLEEALIVTSLFWSRYAERFGLTDKIRELGRRVRGMRLYGAAALELAYVACGRLDGFFSPSLSPWDFAAGALLVKEAGGMVTTVDGTPLSLEGRTTVLAGAPAIYRALRTYLEPEPQDK
ncbi:MAG: inositol monophosphatase [Bacillota bacterium]|jgi:Archaeal fructose-1,6-bisphosphatase and related enzymes of inositol monophosphatase family|nr:inositol monophosphatase [Bacillota bacterium]